MCGWTRQTTRDPGGGRSLTTGASSSCPVVVSAALASSGSPARALMSRSSSLLMSRPKSSLNCFRESTRICARRHPAARRRDGRWWKGKARQGGRGNTESSRDSHPRDTRDIVDDATHLLRNLDELHPELLPQLRREVLRRLAQRRAPLFHCAAPGGGERVSRRGSRFLLARWGRKKKDFYKQRGNVSRRRRRVEAGRSPDARGGCAPRTYTPRRDRPDPDPDPAAAPRPQPPAPPTPTAPRDPLLSSRLQRLSRPHLPPRPFPPLVGRSRSPRSVSP